MSAEDSLSDIIDVDRIAQTIILGFTGSLGSGCTFLAEGIQKCHGNDGHYFRLSDYIRESLREKGINNPTSAQMQDEGDRLREDELDYLVARFLDDVEKKEADGVINQDSVILVDGIRNMGEVKSLRVCPNFYLVAVHSSKDIRKSRLVGDGKLFKDSSEFDVADDRDLYEEGIDWGQQVQLCSDSADIIINNEDRFPENSGKKEEFFSAFDNKYVKVMRALREGRVIPDRSPSMHETLMTMASCASMRSSCDKRKVGAVIAHVREYKELADKIKRHEDDIRYQVVSSGYNEVPLGTSPCRLSGDEQCYRTTLQQAISNGFKHCPQCGQAIRLDEDLGRGDIYKYQCECGAVLGEYLPGGGGAAGKLLDMCRSLHAEENAILGLSGISKSAKGDLVLYTTTFPCNLCANKIVEAGISTVVYAEPYPMKEARDILDLGGVKVVKFEGVKSSAYFRMYAI